MPDNFNQFNLGDQWREDIAGRVTIRILFYCDDMDESWTPVSKRNGNATRFGKDEFGLGLLKTTLENQSSIFVRYKVDVVNRYYDYDDNGNVIANPNLFRQPHKLTRELLSRYSQIWVFGMHYGNGIAPAPNFSRQPFDPNALDQELSSEEVEVLRAWMDAGGGVLITGDHSNQIDGLSDYYNLGRALGKNIPRAGEMRVWIGNPVIFGDGNQRYHVDTAGDMDMRNMPKQQDNLPQTVRVKTIFSMRREHIGGPYGTAYFPQWKPHPLFAAPISAENPNGVIDVFPDHVHEGAVRIPANLDRQDWPYRGTYQPKPEIVSWGINKANSANNQEVGLVAAYNGKLCNVGNIVADSTWHHYINVNLVGFLREDDTPDTTLRRLGRYYANLAQYLCSQSILNTIMFNVLRIALIAPGMREVIHGNIVEKGQYIKAALLEHGLLAFFDEMIQTNQQRIMSEGFKHPSNVPVAEITAWLGHMAEQMLNQHISLDEKISPDQVEYMIHNSHMKFFAEDISRQKAQLTGMTRAFKQVAQTYPFK